MHLAPDARVLLTARGVRAFADGLVSIVLPLYLLARGFTPLQIGALVTATLLGSAALTLGVGLRGNQLSRAALLRTVALAMAGTGLLFFAFEGYWLLVAVATMGTLNPSSGDVSVFLPTEQALLPGTVSESQRTALFARYAFIGFSLAAVGSLAAALPELLGRAMGWPQTAALRAVFVVYALLGMVVWWTYRGLSADLGRAQQRAATGLGPSKAIVYRLAALFSLDAFGGGFVVQSIVVVWLSERHDLSPANTGLLFFWAGAASAASALLAPRLARRIGLVRTMAFTHLPANAFLVLAALMPTAPTAVALLLARAVLSQMDVPARTSYVMAVVTPAERAAAASLTNVPRSLATAATPFAAGWLLSHSSFGWPLIIGGALKAIYDVILLIMFRELRPPEERAAR